MKWYKLLPTPSREEKTSANLNLIIKDDINAFYAL